MDIRPDGQIRPFLRPIPCRAMPSSRRPSPVARRRRAVALAVAALLGIGACAPPGELAVDGPPDGTVFGPGDTDTLVFTIDADTPGRLDNVTLLVDGVAVPAERDGTRLRFAPEPLDDGPLAVEVLDGDTVTHRWDLEVDTTPPPLTLEPPPAPLVAGATATITGTSEPGARIAIDDDPTAGGPATTTADETGRFALRVDATDRAVEVRAADAAGNVATAVLELVTVPSRVTLDAYRGVHVSFCGWTERVLREPILEMIAEGRINAIQLDIKDEAGQVGYDTDVPLAHQIGAVPANCPIDLEAAVAELHALGVPVIGRLVAFADPLLAQWAWEHGRPELAVQTAEGELYIGRYAGFGNLAHPEVVAYNVDIAVDAASKGVDHILWDYVRRPDGSLEGMRFDGLEGSPTDAIVAFVRTADEALAPYGVQHGASVYGIAATRPHEIAQEIPRIAEHVDYVAPMVYPSHWAPGEYGVANPNREPHAIVHASLGSFQDAVAGRRARVVPWLEDTLYASWDRPFQVAEQLRATAERDIDEWLLWDPWVRYTPEVLEPRD
jgi:hypothetical protein